jgi:predicted anti-sigma-YlaC factor YlaD
MNCKSVQIYLSAYLDGELGGQECLQVREHLCGCRDCRAEEQQLRSLKQMLRGLPTYTPSHDFEDRLVANVMDKAEGRRVFAWNLNWRLASGLAACAALAAFGLFQITERRVPSSPNEAAPSLAQRDMFERDYSRDQLFMSGNDPLSGNRFAVPTGYDKK